MGDVIRRRLARAAAATGGAAPGADQGWRLAFARAARDGLGLHVDCRGQRVTRTGLAELLEMLPEHALVALLDGPAAGLGLIALAPATLAALVEVQTVGRVGPQPPAPRRPTRTDAAMVAGVIDLALAGLETALADEADLEWAGGFRYASFIEDTRPLGLLLEDQPYRLLVSDLALGEAGRAGQVILALPAEGRGERPARAAGEDGAAEGAAFAGALAEVALGAECVLATVIARVTMPIAAFLDLAPGGVVALPGAALDRITVTGIDGRAVGLARLGQQGGMRALRLTAEVEADAAMHALPAGLPRADATAAAPVAEKPAPVAVPAEPVARPTRAAPDVPARLAAAG